MNTVALVERRFDRPISLERLVRADAEARWCLSTHKCHAMFQSISIDGLTSQCVYAAPDAEALRNAGRQLGIVPQPLVWSATVHFPPGADASHMNRREAGEACFALVDRKFDQAVDFEELQAQEDAKSSCLTIHSVRFLCSFFSLDRHRMACIYAAPDVEAVRMAVRLTDLPFEAVHAAYAHE